MELFNLYAHKIRNLFINKSDSIRAADSDKMELGLGLGLHRLNLLCLSMLFVSIFYFYIDNFMFAGMTGSVFLRNLKFLHSIIVITSMVYIIAYRKLKKSGSSEKLQLKKFMFRFYIFITTLIAASISINSQLLTGNIHIYMVTVIFIAVAFPFEPLYMFVSYLINHIVFLTGITMLGKNMYVTISNQINSTFTVVMAFLLLLTLYRYISHDAANRNRLMANEDTLRKLFYVNPFPILITRFGEGTIAEANEKALKFYGISSEDIGKVNIKDMYINIEDRNILLDRLEKTGNVENYTVELKTARGRKKWIICNSRVIEYKGEKSIIYGATDITEIKKLENQLIIHASTDLLTGTLNRRSGIQVIEKLLSGASEQYVEFTVCFIDVDGLKAVNDKYGHNEGDALLSIVCKIINEEIEDEDILFRIGGDEFIALFLNKSADFVNDICSNIKKRYQLLNNLEFKPYNISTSFGVFEYTSDMELSVEEIIDYADREMYKEKVLNSIRYKLKS